MHHSKKILFTTENASWGGSELLWSLSIPELVKLDCTIAICVQDKLKLPDWVTNLEGKQEILVYRTSAAILSKAEKMLNRLLPYKFRITAKNKRREFITSYTPDLLVINQGFNFNGVDLMLFASKSNFKYVTISHAVNESLWPELNLRNKMKIAFKNSQKNYFVSQDNLAVTEAQLGSKLVNAQIVRNPFNVPFAVNLDYPSTDNFQLACVGRYDFYAKGQDVLLRVLALDKWKNRSITVNFYGEGKDLENLRDLINLYKVKNALIHNHTKTIDIWKQNHALVLTSRFEGLPLVVVESMLCRRMCIVTDVSGNKELLKDNITGFIAAAPRPEYVDEALERAWQQRANWKQIGEEARRHVERQIPANPALVFAHKLLEIIDSKY